jgi:hypothetical protein
MKPYPIRLCDLFEPFALRLQPRVRQLAFQPTCPPTQGSVMKTPLIVRFATLHQGQEITMNRTEVHLAEEPADETDHFDFDDL